MVDSFHPPRGWKVNGTWKAPDYRSPFITVSLRQFMELVPFLIRYFRFWLKQYKDGVLPFIDSFRPLVYKPDYGVPCGGIGSGSIGRGFRGEFCKFALKPCQVEHGSTVIADQFLVNVQLRGSTVYQQALCCAPVTSKELSSWSFGFPAENINYTALYPRSWTTYKIPQRNIVLSCRQISPVFPGNYKDTSLPASVFEWTIVNNETEAVSVSIALTFRNGIGNKEIDRCGNCTSRAFEYLIDGSKSCVKGVILNHSIDGQKCSYALAAIEDKMNFGCCVTQKLQFNPCGNGAALWSDFAVDGAFDRGQEVSEPVDQMGVALSVKCHLSPGQKAVFPISLVWHMPVVKFGSGIGRKASQEKKRSYRRRYTRWFGTDDNAVIKLCSYALEHYIEWENSIQSWQESVLNNKKVPDWYKSALFNELYFVTDGGSIWVEFDDSWLNDEKHISAYTVQQFKEFGRFAYLESWEYRMLNTYDVHFYASFSLALLWPEIEHCVQAEFCDQIPFEDLKPIISHFEGEVAPVKTRFRVPHDLGCPDNEPWLNTNSYEMHNTARWRDLNLKFVLQTYRDYLVLGEKGLDLLKHCWPAVQKLIEVGLTEWDVDGDGMIENSSSCDQTYDAWTMSGTSAYCGSLWLAALKAGAKIAELLGHEDVAREYLELLNKAKLVFDEKLWTGEYYKFDEFSRNCDTIMADQLSGYWYLRTCGISDNVLDHEKVLSCLRKVYEYNVLKFADGLKGAVNGMRPSGCVDEIAIQSHEVWTGVTYSLAAHMIQEGLWNEGFHTASGIYNTCFHEAGFQFQTPEAFQKTKFYRAIGYMRPLAIWAIQWTLEKFCNFSGVTEPVSH